MSSRNNHERLTRLLEEKDHLLAKRTQILADLKSIDRQIADVSTEYGKLHNEEQIINRIPDDIIHIILLHAKSMQRASKPIGRRAEILYSAICSRWREATLSFGDIWHTFRTSHPSHNAHNRLVACLERSGTHPLDLWFDFRPVGLHDLPDGFHLLRESIKYVQRWRTFTILTELETPLQFLLEHLRHSQAPLLESFTATTDRAWECDMETATLSQAKPLMLQAGTPSLRYLCLNDLSALICLPPIDAITDLRLDMIEGVESAWVEWDVFLKIMQLPSLATLSLIGQVFKAPTEEEFVFPKVTMPSLEHLRHASLLSTGFVDFVLPNLVAPNLISLTLKDLPLPSEQSDIFWTATGESASSQTPFPQLQMLVLIDFEFYGQASFISRLSELTSNAQTLVVSDGCMAWDRQRVNLNDPYTSGWRGIQTLALNTLSPTLELREIANFIRRRPRMRKLFTTVWTMGATDWTNLPQGLKECGLEVEALRWRNIGDVGSCLGPWPPGAKDNDGVDDPFTFELYTP